MQTASELDTLIVAALRQFVGAKTTLDRYTSMIDGTDAATTGIESNRFSNLKSALDSLDAVLKSQPITDALVFASRVTGLWPSS